MGGVPNELILGLPPITLSAKSAQALWLVIPISAILIAVAWRIVASKRQ